MDSVFVPENGYLDLLHSDIDPLQLCAFLDPKPSGDEEGDFSTDLEVDASSYEQLNNVDFPCENGDGLYPSSNTTDAYAKIAELVDYVLKDQQEKQVEDIFAGNLILDDIAAENTEKFPDIKMQTCLKRTFLGSAESYCDASEPKYKKIVEVPTVSAGDGSFFAMPFNSHPVSCPSLTNQHMSFSVPAAHGLERSFIISGM
ncbi:C2TA protein, partial [Pachycephala philippinensis]|nr:C2TA protein [Pachycephala philippinensis]